MSEDGAETGIGPVPVPADAGPGWYQDPAQGSRSRWWDGREWTWQVTDGRSVGWDPVPEGGDHSVQRGLPGLGVAVVGFVAGAALGIVAQVTLALAGKPGGWVVALPVSEAGLWSALIGACVVVSRRRGTGHVGRDMSFAFRPVDLGLGLAAAIAGRMMSSAAVVPFTFLLVNHKSKPPDQQTLGHLAHGPAGWTVLVLVTCVGAPVVEELFFRGLVQTRLVQRWGPVAGIAVTSALFGAAHLIGWAGPISLLYAWAVAFGGLALGTARHLTGRLGTSMIAHCLFNAQAVIALAAVAAIR
ncbi:MAG TPA: CPBP family glutamic-type intramembrane protease [Acidimicrobiales bacterium]|nr:CPBP family glutamic-type intramembrane protease [Acidimicrobiales bacterium]